MSGNTSPLGGPDASVVLANLSTSIIGGIFNSFFFALATIQAAYYWQHYWENDRPYLRCMLTWEVLKVTLVTVLSAFHMTFYTYTLWSFLIPSHAGVLGSSVTGLPWTAYAQFIANAMGIFAVHVFYLNRLWTLSQNRVFVTVLGILILEVFALAIYTTIYAITNTTASILARIVHVETALCTSLAVADVTTTTSLVTLLLRSRNSGMKSQRLVKRLIFYTLTTGTLTALCAVFALIANLKFPETIISTTFYDLGASLYACAFLSSLNTRQSLRGKFMETDNGLTTGGATVPYFPCFATAPFTSGAFGGLTTASGNVTHSHMQVRIEQGTTVHSDPARSVVGERPRKIRGKPSKTVTKPPESHHGSECSFLPPTKEFDANGSDPGLAV